MRKAAVRLSKGAALSISRPAIAYLPLFFVTIAFRGDLVRLAEASRFFVWFSLVAAVGSQGIGNYIYSVIISSGGKVPVGLLRLLTVLRGMLFCRWTLFSFCLACIGFLSFVRGSDVFLSLFMSIVAVILGPIILVTSQLYTALGMSLSVLRTAFLQSLLLLLMLFLFDIESRQINSLQTLCVFSGISCVSFALLASVAKWRTIYRLFRYPKRLSGFARVGMSARLKCFSDSLLPPLYVALIILALSRSDSVYPDKLIFNYYSYSRISDSLISVIVVLYTYFVLPDRSLKVSKAGLKSPYRSKNLASRDFRLSVEHLVFGLFFLSSLILLAGYAYNCTIAQVCLLRLALFDYSVSLAKIGYIIGSFYFVIFIPRVSLMVQFLSMIAVIIISFAALPVRQYLLVYALISWLCLSIPVYFLIKSRSLRSS